MAIAPISSLGNIPGAPSLDALKPAAKTDGNFGNAITGALDNLQATQNNADQLGVQAATGNLQDVHDYMIAATQASLQTELTVAVRNKALDAFNDIMRMQI